MSKATMVMDERVMAPAISVGAPGNSQPLHLVTNVWRYRQLLTHMISRNIRIQYKQSILGYAWILLNPITQLLTLDFVFSVVFPTRATGPDRAPFTLLLFVGLLPWIFFSNAILAATDSVSGGSNLVTGVYFPRELLVVAAVLVRLVDLLAGAIILAALMVIEGQSVGWAAFWVPLLFVFHIFFLTGLSLPLAALNLFFHDVRYLVGVAIYLWFFFTPIFYSLSAVPQRYRFVYDINPNSRLIEAYRYALLQNVGPPLGSVAIIAVLSIASLAIGYFIFKKMEPSFADYI